MSMPLLDAILAACGARPTRVLATLEHVGRAGDEGRHAASRDSTPAAAVNPLTVADAGGLCMLNQTGEFLVFDSNLKLALAADARHQLDAQRNGTVWTFKLRQGVKFHNGQAMTADDVVYTFQQLADPKNASNALSTFTGVLTPAASRRSTRRRSPSISRRRTATSPTWSPRTTTTRSSCPRDRLREVAEHVHRHRRVQAQSYTQGVGATFVANPTTGAPSRTWTAPRSRSTRASSRRSSRSRAATVDVIGQFAVRAPQRCSTAPRTTSSA